MTLPIDTIIEWIKQNELLMGLLVSAVIGAMPEKLPLSLRSVPQWCWTWFHDSSKMFLNFRRGANFPVQSPVNVTLPEQQPSSVSSVTVSKTTTEVKSDPVEDTKPQQLNG